MSDAERVLSLLGNASVTQSDMAFVLGLTIRQVQSACEELRRAGHPIISDRNGVRLAASAEEAQRCADALRRRLVSQYLTMRALRRTARRMRTAEDAAASLTLWRVASPFLMSMVWPATTPWMRGVYMQSTWLTSACLVGAL